MIVTFTLNGGLQRCEVPAHWTLLRMLRDAAGHTEAKHGCGEGVCGACAVFVDGVAVNSCSMLAPQVEGAEVETVAGLAEDGELHPLQAELVASGGVQCGFCTPGMVISGIEAVRIGAAGSEEEIRHSLAGNLCRCTGYGKIVGAVGAYRERAGDRADERGSASRSRPDRRVVGSDLARHDAIEKVAGRTSYAADFALPGMLHARLKRSDYAHARLARVDTSAAEAIDGVVAVYTAADVPQNTVWVDVPGQTLEVGALKARSNVLADEVVRYHGEPIALVAAETEDAALAAARRDRGRLRAAAGGRRSRAGARSRRPRAPRGRQPARPLGARGGRGRAGDWRGRGGGRGRVPDPVHRPRLPGARGRRRVARHRRRDHDPRRDPGGRALPRRRQDPRAARQQGAA